jgi:hypothetical protein
MHGGDPMLRVEAIEHVREEPFRFSQRVLEIRRCVEPRVHDDAIVPDVAFDTGKEVAADRP